MGATEAGGNVSNVFGILRLPDFVADFPIPIIIHMYSN